MLTLSKASAILLSMESILPVEVITSKIYLIRNQRVMLDRDLATLYGVETKVLNQSVHRNLDRFPDDFMFQLNSQEFDNLKSQIVTSSWGGLRKIPFAFTENGIAMLSSILKSKNAVRTNILIMRVFTKLRNLMASNEELREKVAQLDHKQKKTDDDIAMLISAVNMLLEPQPEDRNPRRIGFYKEN